MDEWGSKARHLESRAQMFNHDSILANSDGSLLLHRVYSFLSFPLHGTTLLISLSSSYCSFPDAAFQAQIHLCSSRTGLTRQNTLQHSFPDKLHPALTMYWLHVTCGEHSIIIKLCLYIALNTNTLIIQGAHVCMTAQSLWSTAESPEEKEK